MINNLSILYIALGTHPSDSKRFFTVGTTTLRGLQCREYNKHMDVLWTIPLSDAKSKGAWDSWDTKHMGPWLDKHFTRTRVMYDATMMRELGCHQSRTNSWWIAPKSPREQLNYIIDVVTEKLAEIGE